MQQDLKLIYLLPHIHSLTIILTLLIRLASFTPCYPGAIFPKLIGYGLAETSIVSVDRRASDGRLAMAVITAEDDIVGQASVPSDTGTWMSYDPDADSYVWVKIIEGVKPDKARTFVRFTGDGSKVLAIFKFKASNSLAFAYFNAADGALLTTHSYEKLHADGRVVKDGIVVSNDGSSIFYIMNRPTFQASVIGAIGFDSTNAATPWTNNGFASL